MNGDIPRKLVMDMAVKFLDLAYNEGIGIIIISFDWAIKLWRVIVASLSQLW